MSRPPYLPWVRSGLTRAATIEDQLSGPLPSRASVRASAVVAGQASSVEVRVIGPGDVTGLDPRLVIRTQPKDRAIPVETNYFCVAELRTSDLPWMFTPAAPKQDRLRPYLVLVVVPLDVCALDAGSGDRLPVLRVDRVNTQLPDLAQSYAWVHAEGTGPNGLSRLMCPRELQANKHYIAAIVPAFEPGRLRGLGMAVPDAETMQPAWDAASNDSRDLPVYYSWTFTTGRDGDFEALVSRLQRVRLGGDATAGRPAVVDAQAGLPALPGWRFPGALGECDDPPPRSNFVTALGALIDGVTAVPGLPVPPPLYGGRHAAETRIAISSRPWLRQLNLDPRYRSAAALGTRLVQEHQEDLMAAAWTQIGEVEAANALLRQAQLARSAASALHRRMSSINAAVLLQLTGPMLTRLMEPSAGTTVASRVAASRVPARMVSGAFRRILRPRGPLGRRTGRTAAGLLTAVNNGTPVVPDRGRPDGIVTIDTLRDDRAPRWCQVKPDALRERIDRPQRPASVEQWNAVVTALAEAHRDKPPCDPIPSRRGPLPLEATKTAILVATQPATTIPKRIGTRVKGPPGWNPADPLTPIMATPRVDTPLSRDLIALAPDFLLPGISGLPTEAVSAVPATRRFIEALMIGANHKMMRELIWRGYPTDQRGTCLHRFWERGGSLSGVADDIPDIDETWTGELGSLQLGSPSVVVLVVRGELLPLPSDRHLCRPSAMGGGRRRPVPVPSGLPVTDLAYPERYPAFTGTIPSDVAYVGFDLPDDVRGVQDPAAARPGWLFVFQQPPTEIRFGLDGNPSETCRGQAPPIYPGLR